MSQKPKGQCFKKEGVVHYGKKNIWKVKKYEDIEVTIGLKIIKIFGDLKKRVSVQLRGQNTYDCFEKIMRCKEAQSASVSNFYDLNFVVKGNIEMRP